MKKIKLLTPIILGTSTVGLLLPLASCGCSSKAEHVVLDSEASVTANEDNEATYKLKLDNTYADLNVEYDGTDTDLFKVTHEASDKSVTVTVKFKSFVNEESTFNFGLKVSATGLDTKTISGLSIKIMPQADQTVVNNINTILRESEEVGVKPATMSALIALLDLKGIDLETLSTSSEDCQWVWDCEKNVVFVLSNKGTVKCAPAGYELNDYKVNIWKMVASNKATFRTKYSNNLTVAKDAFSETSQYSQYLRSGETFDKELTFCSGLDTGEHTGLELTFTKDTTLEEDQPVAIICTDKCSLTVESELNDIEHHGNLTTLKIEELPEDGTYTEFGSVDATIVIKDGSLVAEKGSDINTVLVEVNASGEVTVGTITIEENANVGTLFASSNVPSGTSTESFIDSASPSRPETVEEEHIVVADADFDAGMGTERSPYAISKVSQLLNCALYVNGGTDENQRQPLTQATALHFKLIADIDLTNVNWTPIGKNKEFMFFGSFDGNGFTISNLKNHTTSGTYPYGESTFNTAGGLFGWTSGNFNNDYSLEDVSKPAVDKIWDKTNKEVFRDNITEDKYSTVIKNVTLDNVDIQFANAEDNVRLVGGIVGQSTNTYISNCKVKSGTIIANKHVGGIVGSSTGTIVTDCTVGDDTKNSTLKISALGQNVAGIVGSCDYIIWPTVGSLGSTNHAILNCSTKENCTITAQALDDGYVGGILSYCENLNTMVIDNCINNAKVVSIGQLALPATDNCGIAGIAPLGSHINVVSNCVNNGEIVVDGSNEIANAAGILTVPGGNNLVYKCKNTGKISANALRCVAGIVAGCRQAGVTSQTFTIESCTNSGTLENLLHPQDPEYIFDISDLQ